MKKALFALTLAMFFSLALKADAERLIEASNSLKTILSIKNIPRAILQRSAAVAVFPKVHQAGLFLGGMAGQGVVVKRNAYGWSKPININIKGGSLGFQFGYQQGSMVFFVLNPNIAKDMTHRKITLDVDASITAWNFGDNYSDATDFKLTSDIYMFTKNKGAFAGVSFGGAVINVENVQPQNTQYSMDRWKNTLELME